MQAECRLVSQWFASSVRLRWLSLLMAATFLSWSAPAFVLAEDDKPKKEKEIPPPEDLVLTTGDGLELAVTYYPGTKGKQTIPVVLLHMWKQSRNDYKELAPTLQALGYAVVVPDLRGHGDSKHRKGASKDEKLDAATLSASQFGQMVTKDMMAVKQFLWEQNNAGQLNIDKLCIVGAEMGASVALNFALADAVDQDNNRVQRAEYKVGRFVKALVLISPEPAFRGLPTRDATAYPAVQRDIPILMVVGKQDAKALQEAKRINSIFERHHPDPTGDTVSEKNDKRTLFFVPLPTSLQGTKLLDPKFNVASLISDFLNRRLSKCEESKDWTWCERKIPHE